jgi:hypothetical protein
MSSGAAIVILSYDSRFILNLPVTTTHHTCLFLHESEENQPTPSHPSITMEMGETESAFISWERRRLAGNASEARQTGRRDAGAPWEGKHHGL